MLFTPQYWYIPSKWPYIVYSKSYHYAVNTGMGNQFVVQIKNSLEKRTRSLAYLWPKLVKWRFYRFIGQ